MKTSILLAAGAAALLTSAPAAFAQDVGPASAVPPTTATVIQETGPSGNWTLKQREEWVNTHIDKARDEKDISGRDADRAHHALDLIRDDENRMRDRHDGQLTDNETTSLESRLDQMAANIHWAHDNAFQRPW
jgi:hypothetical protein